MDKFKTIEDLYKKLNPVLSSKVRELNNLGYNYIKDVDIWNYLTKTKWSKCKSLSLYNIVDDIFNLENEEINKYVLDLLKQDKRKLEEMDVL